MLSGPKSYLRENPYMKKSREETAETRQMIVKTAAAEFRKNGLQMGVADLMSAAGLTHGGFYRHFQSKDELVAEACVEALNTLIDSLALTASKNADSGPLKAVVLKYLSTGHRDHPANGCAFAFLGGEIARCEKKTREAVAECYQRLIDLVAGLLPAELGDRGREAQFIVTSMLGAIVMCRIPTDRALSARILNDTAEQIITRYSL
jgi:TetR/AcrR family transcriptional regulator, transcriptional repressor for nem operon